MNQHVRRRWPRFADRRGIPLVASLALVAGLIPGLATNLPAVSAPSEDTTGMVSFAKMPGWFPLVRGAEAAPIVVSSSDHEGVVQAAGDLRTDIHRVTRKTPELLEDTVGDRIVLVGTIGKSPLIDKLVQSGRLDVKGVRGGWETSLQTTVRDPFPGVRQAFVIAGSDQRGTIYGIYELSKQIGVSPWHFWDDVPAVQHDSISLKPGRHSQGTPAVKYRGFFINDEAPNLSSWAPTQFGPGLAPGHPHGFNSKFYARVFEVMLRLKANYLWPAVWGRAFAEDDPVNHELATRYGVVMGTSHEAPMMRGIEEWNRHATPAVRDAGGNIIRPGSDPYGGTGEWSFIRNRAAITQYWRDGVRRMRDEAFEGVVTLGMRGNGDTALPDGSGRELMEEIIAVQRRILTEELGAGTVATDVPQVFTLYKEVQRYWDQGLRPPDDVTVVFADDNWGNMRKVPDRNLAPRKGGYGLYYHFDYVGGNRNYKWVDTVNLASTWEQLNTSYQYGIDRLWVVNVGDLKNAEMSTQFFLDYAWSPSALPLEKLGTWEKDYAAQNFGPSLADAVADILHDYSLLQSRRKPELLNRRQRLDPAKDPSTSAAIITDDKATPFSVDNYQELATVTDEWQALAARARQLRSRVPESWDDAYFQLVYYQVVASANVYELREAQWTNLLYAQQGRSATNEYADVAEARFATDQQLSSYYNTQLAGGKWTDFQRQTKLGYGDKDRYGPNASWQEPPQPDQIYPALQRIQVPEEPEMGVTIDGAAGRADTASPWWPKSTQQPVLPEFSPYQTAPRQYIEVFNRGRSPFSYEITPGASWLRVSKASGTVDKEIRAHLFVDWKTAPKGTTTVPIVVKGSEGTQVTVQAVLNNPALEPVGHIESQGTVSINADHFTRKVSGWKVLEGIGRTGNGVTPWPVTAPSRTPGGDSARLEYKTTLTTAGPVRITAYLSPRNSVLPSNELRYGISVDDAAPQIVNVTKGVDHTSMNGVWGRHTSDNVNRTATTHVISSPGVHTLKFWMVDPTVVLQKLVIDTGGERWSYLGPPESMRG